MKFTALLVVLLSVGAQAQTLTVATYNVEHFAGHFLARHLSSAKPKVLPDTPQVQELLESERKHNEEDNWEVAQVILDPKFAADVIVFQEGCKQEDLEYFNHTFLQDAYGTVIVFPGNSDRDQMVGMMIKPGFKVIEKKDQYFKEQDTVPNERGNLLFARGPAFVLIESPAGYRFWVGTNHQKSKSDNSVDVTKWRMREAKRTHQIIKEIEKAGPTDVVFLGDMNDELGIQGFELQAGGDVIENLVGPPADGLTLATRPLADTGKISFFGYSRTDYHSLIDHILVTRSMKDQIIDVQVFQNAFTAVASDHCPVMIKFRSDRVGRN